MNDFSGTDRRKGGPKGDGPESLTAVLARQCLGFLLPIVAILGGQECILGANRLMRRRALDGLDGKHGEQLRRRTTGKAGRARNKVGGGQDEDEDKGAVSNGRGQSERDREIEVKGITTADWS